MQVKVIFVHELELYYFNKNISGFAFSSFYFCISAWDICANTSVDIGFSNFLGSLV